MLSYLYLCVCVCLHIYVWALMYLHDAFYVCVSFYLCLNVYVRASLSSCAIFWISVCADVNTKVFSSCMFHDSISLCMVISWPACLFLCFFVYFLLCFFVCCVHSILLFVHSSVLCCLSVKLQKMESNSSDSQASRIELEEEITQLRSRLSRMDQLHDRLQEVSEKLKCVAIIAFQVSTPSCGPFFRRGLTEDCLFVSPCILV